MIAPLVFGALAALVALAAVRQAKVNEATRDPLELGLEDEED